MGPFPREFKSLSRRHTPPNHNLHGGYKPATTVGDDRGPRRRWYALMAVAVLLHVLAMSNSDLGLDAHVRLNAAMDNGEQGQDLAWGKLRVANSTEQAPTDLHEYDGYIAPWSTSETSVKTTAFVGVLAVACLAALSPRWVAGGFVFNPMRAALVLFSPIFLFVSARGYDEGMLALIASLGAVGFLFNQGNQRHERLLHVVMMATSVLLLLGWKGFEGTFGLGAFVVTLIAGVSWTVLEDGRTGSFGDWLRHPWKMALTAALMVMLAVVVAGFAMQAGTFGIIAERPLVFAVATTVASVHAIGLFLLVGFVLWPLLAERWPGLAKLRGAGPTMLAVYTAVLLTGVVAYIGALWTLESDLWNRTLFETVLVLGNNGRYATVVLVPLVLLLSWPNKDVDAPSHSGGKPVAFGLSLLVPLMLFVAFHGQQLWSDDAGAWLTDSMDEDESCFVMVAPETLAMHHLYVIKSSVDLTGDRGIDAYWRTAEHVDAFLGTQNECSGLLLVAPNEAYSPGNGWLLVHEESAPFTLSGGGDTGSWKVFRALA